MIPFAKSNIKFVEETNIFVRYSEEYVKNGVCVTGILYQIFQSRK